jgi:sugar-phosphatase
MPILTYNCDVVLADMDGTLVDSTASVERQWKRWAARHGLDPAPILKVSHGRRTVETMREVAPYLLADEEAVWFDEEEAQDRAGVKALAGAAEFLASLPAGQWAVVTSANHLLASDRLATAGLLVPPVLIAAEDVARGKPDPEGFLRAAHLLGVKPERCLVIEDTPPGLRAGRAGGMQLLGMATTYSPEFMEGVPCIADFTAVRVSVIGRTLHIEVRPVNATAATPESSPDTPLPFA